MRQRCAVTEVTIKILYSNFGSDTSAIYYRYRPRCTPGILESASDECYMGEQCKYRIIEISGLKENINCLNVREHTGAPK